jgi:hypothetical protein
MSHRSALNAHKLLELHFISSHDVQGQPTSIHPQPSEGTSVYDIGFAKPVTDVTLRQYFQTQGISGNALNSSIELYSRSALQRAQRALQNAYALNRLGSALSATELSSVGVASQQQWTEMVHKHAAALEGQFRELHGQLAEILTADEGSSNSVDRLIRIENSAQFNAAASQILKQTQDLNSDIGRLFTSNPSAAARPSNAESLLAATMHAIPLQDAEEINRFAGKLKTAGNSVRTVSGQQDGVEGILKRPQ